MPNGTLLYAQSGGVTAVINATASAVISTARAKGIKVLAARNGILGALREDLIDTSKETAAAIAALAHTPGGAFGSCRYKLKSLEADRGRYERLLQVPSGLSSTTVPGEVAYTSRASVRAPGVKPACRKTSAACSSRTQVGTCRRSS